MNYEFPVRMVHEDNGATHAYDKGEVERLITYGWKVEQPKETKTITLPKKDK